MTRVFLAGFPHSDICGSMDVCSSPQLFAACHVLLRLLAPRHSPFALSSLTFFVSVIAFAITFRECRSRLTPSSNLSRWYLWYESRPKSLGRVLVHGFHTALARFYRFTFTSNPKNSPACFFFLLYFSSLFSFLGAVDDYGFIQTITTK